MSEHRIRAATVRKRKTQTTPLPHDRGSDMCPILIIEMQSPGSDPFK